jgi:hypothetical protein
MRILLNILAFPCYIIGFLSLVAAGNTGQAGSMNPLWNVPMVMLYFAFLVHLRFWLMLILGFLTMRWLTKD